MARFANKTQIFRGAFVQYGYPAGLLERQRGGGASSRITSREKLQKIVNKGNRSERQ